MLIEHISTEGILFFILYGISGVVPLLAALYLLLRQGNVFAQGVTPPVRLRRWTASFFAVSTLAHVWWLLFYIYSGDQQSVAYLVLVMLDCMLLFTTFVGMLLAMLQDRHRPVWPALVAMIPFVALGGAFTVNPNELMEQIVSMYLLLLSLFFTGYMVFAIRQYERWLNDNYADLENKKVWLCQAVALGCMLLFVLYVLATDMLILWLIHVIELVLVGLMLWRVETLPRLTPVPSPIGEESEYTQGGDSAAKPSTSLPHREGQGGESAESESSSYLYIDLAQIERLLKEHCVNTQLYLQHDLTLQQLAHAIGTNRSYLSQYFSRQGITYNTYINNLRINHFIDLYQKAAATSQTVGAKQLAYESGFRSYSTFSRAFMQRTGQSVTAWMRDTGE